MVSARLTIISEAFTMSEFTSLKPQLPGFPVVDF